MSTRKLWIGIGSVSTVVVCMGLCIFVLTNVEVGYGTPKLSPEDNLPDRAIAFRITDDSYPDNSLGFINADGSGLVVRSISTQIACRMIKMQWSADGNYLVTRSCNGTRSYPLLFSPEGEFLQCGDAFVDREQIFALRKDYVLVTTITESVEQIAVVDMTICRQTSILYSGNSIVDYAVSTQGWLAVSESPNGLSVLDSEGKLVTREDDIAQGLSWSRDGEWLAYQAEHTLVTIVRKDGTDKRILTDVGALPSWSPDGQWIAYSFCSNGCTVSKINVETGEIVELFAGGQNPTWRWP